MNQDELEALLQEQVQDRNTRGEHGQWRANRVGILTQEPVSRRLLEGLSVQLDLEAEVLAPGTRDLTALLALEMIIADEAEAVALRDLLRNVKDGEDGYMPALVAIRQRTQQDTPAVATRPEMPYEGVLVLPEQPSLVTAQLGVILYAHRAYVRRYRDAMEELHLNRRIFRSVTSGITVARAEKNLPLVYVNPAFEVITGFSIEESLGENCRFLQGNLREQPGLILIREALKQGREIKAIVRNFRKDGTGFWNELSISPIRNHEGVLTHFVGIQQDVTARVEFEEALRESEKLATAGRLAASIAHEINNPLEAVTNLIYLARRSDSLAAAEVYLSQADDELRRVALLTSQSLRFYKQSTAPQAIRASDLLDSVMDVYARRMDALHIEVQKRERSCESVMCFESELRQVLSNLIRNAMDALTAQGGGRLLVRTREATDWQSGAKGILITVADTGGGMSQEVRERIFEAFYSTKGNSGTGLGLWVSREIMNRHRGHMRVRSRAGTGPTGTVFAMFVPYQGLVP